MDWVQEEAARARARMGVTDRPAVGDLLGLIEASGIRVVHAAVPSPYTIKTPRGVTMVVPCWWRHGEENARDFAHEFFHADNPHHGYGDLLLFWEPNDVRIARLARLHKDRDEAEADAFECALCGQPQ